MSAAAAAARSDGEDDLPEQFAAAKKPLFGYLDKKKSKGRNILSRWNRRWFECFDDRLVYSKSRDDPCVTKIDLKEVTNVRVLRKNKKKNRKVGVMELQTTARTYILRAETQEDLDRWIGGIRYRLFKLQHPTKPRKSILQRNRLQRAVPDLEIRVQREINNLYGDVPLCDSGAQPARSLTPMPWHSRREVDGSAASEGIASPRTAQLPSGGDGGIVLDHSFSGGFGDEDDLDLGLGSSSDDGFEDGMFFTKDESAINLPGFGSRAALSVQLPPDRIRGGGDESAVGDGDGEEEDSPWSLSTSPVAEKDEASPDPPSPQTQQHQQQQGEGGGGEQGEGVARRRRPSLSSGVSMIINHQQHQEQQAPRVVATPPPRFDQMPHAPSPRTAPFSQSPIQRRRKMSAASPVPPPREKRVNSFTRRPMIGLHQHRPAAGPPSSSSSPSSQPHRRLPPGIGSAQPHPPPLSSPQQDQSWLEEDFDDDDDDDDDVYDDLIT